MILILDDDKGICEVLEMILKELNLEHMIVSTNEKAIEILKKNCPNIFLTDLILEKNTASDSIHFCHQNNKNCQVVLMTAMNTKSAQKIAKDLGIERLLLKPFRLEDLSAILK